MSYAGKFKNTFHTRCTKERKEVAIYARVSTNNVEQLKSLSGQVSALTRLTASTPQWLLVDVYMDIASSKTGSSRKEFNRMFEDCNAHKIVLDALNQLKLVGVRVIFEKEELDTANTDSDLMISIIEDFAQVENESRSYNIKWGIKQRAAQGTSKLDNRKYYGYKNDVDGSLVIDDIEAKNVKLIFDLYLQGKSIIGIVKELERLGIKSPTGNATWPKRTIDVILSNEKYKGSTAG